MPGDSGVLVVARVRSTTTKCTRGRGCNGHPAFPHALFGRKIHQRLGRFASRGRECVSENRTPSFPDVQVHIVDAPLGAGPESILPVVVMDSGLARSLSSGRALRGPVGAPRNDESFCATCYAPGKSKIRLATMPSMTSLVPPSIELALVRSQARGRAPPLERSLSHSSASAPPADIKIS